MVSQCEQRGVGGMIGSEALLVRRKFTLRGIGGTIHGQTAANDREHQSLHKRG